MRQPEVEPPYYSYNEHEAQFGGGLGAYTLYLAKVRLQVNYETMSTKEIAQSLNFIDNHPNQLKVETDG